MPVDVQALDCDFFVFSGHKMFAPDRHRRRVRQARACSKHMPPWQGGGNMIADVTFEKTVFQGPPDALRGRHRQHRRRRRPRRGASTTSRRIGMSNIVGLRARAAGLRDARAARRCPGCGMIGTAREKAGVLSFVLDECRDRGRRQGARPGGHRRALGPPLRAADPAPLRARGTVRPSLALYNTPEDVDALVAALHRIQTGRGKRGL